MTLSEQIADALNTQRPATWEDTVEVIESILTAKPGRDFFITLPDPERMKGGEHEEGSHELAEARVHTVGQIALPRGRKQIHAREVLP